MKAQSKKGFTLVEIMIVVVIIGLLAAMAIPAFQKVRENSVGKALVNDARQLASAAQQYMMENSTTQATFTVGTDGIVTGQIADYVKQVGKGTTAPGSIDMDATFTLDHPQYTPGPITFTSEGQEVQ